MVNKEKIVAEIDKVPERYFDELYKIIKEFELKTTAQESGSEQSMMSRLRKIKISASPDFSMKANLYNNIEKKNVR